MKHAEDALKMWLFAINSQSRHSARTDLGEAFRDRGRGRRSCRRPNHLYTVAAKDCVELAREFLVAISDEKRQRLGALG